MKKSPAMGLRGYGREQSIWINAHLHRCPWCQKKQGITHLSLFSLDGFNKKINAWNLQYPSLSEGITLVAAVSHAQCGSDYGYNIQIEELFDDPDNWFWHLCTKAWITKGQAMDLIWDVLAIHSRGNAYLRFHPAKYASVQAYHARPKEANHEVDHSND